MRVGCALPCPALLSARASLRKPWPGGVLPVSARGVTASVAHPERPRIGQNPHIGKDVPRETLQALQSGRRRPTDIADPQVWRGMGACRRESWRQGRCRLREKVWEAQIRDAATTTRNLGQARGQRLNMPEKELKKPIRGSEKILSMPVTGFF